MGTVFWDSCGVFLFETLQPGETINAARYCQTLDKLREAIRKKRPGQLTNRVILQHDNATPHTARVTQGWLEKYGWKICHTHQTIQTSHHLIITSLGHCNVSWQESALVTMKSLLTMCGNGYKTLTEVSSERVSIPWCGVGRSVLTDLTVT
ncbi:histone-lysine N-methyltransferase SETMAR [Elysia marginata]|uniref:Histone-lysine N-methyltransferase SETMAR n=1 Tax=Elysia marginata TaxID=1093978 RepID=A0AAV4IKH6_9GAST|nr:histone-lysine N-methyltransferase SETMAR [Elysia marginata]